MAIPVDSEFLAEQRRKAEERRKRFANAEVPEPPKRVMAWPGGKMVSNKEDALREFLKRHPSKEGIVLEQKRRREDSAPAATPSSTTPSIGRQEIPYDERDIHALSEGCLVCLTGKFEGGKSSLKLLVDKVGGHVVPTVNKKVAYVVAAADALKYRTQAVRKAQRRGVPVVSEAWLRMSLALTTLQRREGHHSVEPGSTQEDEPAVKRPRLRLRYYLMARHNPWRTLGFLRGWVDARRHST